MNFKYILLKLSVVIYNKYNNHFNKILGNKTILFDYKYMYELRISFDENDIVECTSIKLIS